MGPFFVTLALDFEVLVGILSGRFAAQPAAQTVA
jgi:hypothetical protein